MNLRIVRKKIKSVDNVKKITKAMELVSAVKMKKFNQLAQESTPYQEFLEKGIKNIVFSTEKKISSLLETPKNSSDRELAILISTNKGLCGAFNISLARFLLKNTNNKTDIVTIGKKGASLGNSLGFKNIADFSSNDPFENVSALFDFVYQQFVQGKYKIIKLFYNSFISVLKYQPVFDTLLPVKFEEKDLESQDQNLFKNYVIEPSAEEIMHSLLLNYIEQKIRFAVIQTQAGEHSARMMAMQNATMNATDILLNLKLLGNKLRQEKITNELLDMITAKESVETHA